MVVWYDVFICKIGVNSIDDIYMELFIVDNFSCFDDCFLDLFILDIVVILGLLYFVKDSVFEI